MNVEVSTLLDVLATPRLQLAIPVYQRRYSWQQKQCEELFDDIYRAGKLEVNHFSGTVLYEQQTPAAEDNTTDSDNVLQTLCVVDGQQRLTTTTLLLIALRNVRQAQGDACSPTHDDVNVHMQHLAQSRTIEETYLTLPAHNEDHPSTKLVLSAADQPLLQQAIAQALDTEQRNNIACNLAYFEERIADEACDLATLLEGLTHLPIVFIELDGSDNPQAIFESLNSKGVQLTLGDMVRNYLLASETCAAQTHLYQEYWTVIEGVFDPDPGSLKLDTMIKAWLSVRFPHVRARTTEEAYAAFKHYYDDEFTGEMESVLYELRSFAMVWAENYRYHAVKKFKSMPWAVNGPQTLTSHYELKQAEDTAYAEKVRGELNAVRADF